MSDDKLRVYVDGELFAHEHYSSAQELSDAIEQSTPGSTTSMQFRQGRKANHVGDIDGTQRKAVGYGN